MEPARSPGLKTPARRLPFSERTPARVLETTPARTPQVPYVATPDQWEMQDRRRGGTLGDMGAGLTRNLFGGMPVVPEVEPERHGGQPDFTANLAELEAGFLASERAARQQEAAAAHLAQLQELHEQAMYQVFAQHQKAMEEAPSFRPDAPVDLLAMAARIAKAQRADPFGGLPVPDLSNPFMPMMGAGLGRPLFPMPSPMPFMPMARPMAPPAAPMPTPAPAPAAVPAVPINLAEATTPAAEPASAPPAAAGGARRSERGERRRGRREDKEVTPGTVVAKAKDQVGCRLLQKKLQEPGNQELVTMVYQEIVPDHVLELMGDAFGNYLMQVVLPKFEAGWVSEVFAICVPKLVELCRSMHGTRAVQELVAVIRKNEEQALVAKLLKPEVVSLAQDLHGNHVIVQCLSVLPLRHREFIYEAVIGSLHAVAISKQGCCVLQKCLSTASPPYLQRLLVEIARFGLPLAQDPFGNYVVQHVLKQNSEELTAMVVEAVKGSVVPLSKQKFSSNVVEKLLQSSHPTVASQFAREIVAADAVGTLMSHEFGNFVIQRLLGAVQGDDLDLVLNSLAPHVPQLVAAPGGPGRALQKVLKKHPWLRKVA